MKKYLLLLAFNSVRLRRISLCSTFCMARLLLAIASCNLAILHSAFSQSGEWVWVHGSNTTNSAGSYGVQGVSSPTNVPPAVYTACAWTDLGGNLWTFGGWGSGLVYGDLWKYDPAINEWTWMKGSGLPNDPGNYGVQGISAPSNNPPSRSCAVSWTDNQGNFWLFSGNRGGDYCDLWKYEVATNEWTWMKGPNVQAQPGVYGLQGVSSPANYPGSRQETSAAWTDASDNLWLMGGFEYIGGPIHFNDLWKYSIATNEWTWMKGSSAGNQAGIYGTPGVEDPANTPGGRWPYAHWIDNAGNLWQWGGYQSISGNFNDMWRYSPVTNSWTWMGGSNTLNAPAVMGTKCIPSQANIPETAWETRAVWKDGDGNFWFFGAGTYVGSFNTYNQLWKYCVATGEWAWISGDAASNPAGSWGTLGVSSPANKPSGRIGSVSWTGSNGALYLLGGESSTGGTYNDLWRFTIDSTCGVCAPMAPTAAFTAVSNTICPGTCTDFTNLSANATSYQWNFPGANPSSSTDLAPQNICYPSPGSFNVELIASNANGSDTLLLSNYITVYPTPPPQSILQSGDTLFANTGAASYQWYFNTSIIPGATEYFYVAQSSGDYNVVATDANGCEVEAVIFNVIASAQAAVSSGSGQEIIIFPNPVGETLFVNSYLLIGAAFEISVYNVFGEKISTVQRVASGQKQEAFINVSSLPAALYYIEVIINGQILRTKFVKRQ
jgi:PKD repeat protein